MGFKSNLLKICLFAIVLTQLNTPAFSRIKKESDAQKLLNASTNQNIDNITPNSNISFNNAFPDKSWWLKFNDPYLTKYIEESLNSNLDLALAKEKINQYKALARQYLGKELPQFSIGGNYTRTYGGKIGFNKALNSNTYTIPLDISYEVDIWHKNRDTTRSANKTAEAYMYDYQTTYIALITSVASAYFNLLNNDKLIELQKEVINAAQGNLDNAQKQYKAGLTDQEDVVIRESTLTTYKAQLQTYYEMQSLAIHQLAILMGKTPDQISDLQREDWDFYSIPQEINAGVSSDLLSRRPDIKAEEARLGAASFAAKAARKELFPTINLGGDLGFNSSTLSNIFDWDSFIASFTAGIAQNLFTGGQRRANLKVYKSKYKQQLITYHSSILTAVQEIDDSVASLNAHKNSYDNYESSFYSLQQKFKIQQNRFNAGSASKADLNPVKLEVFLAKENACNSKLAALTDILSLYKALGGGY